MPIDPVPVFVYGTLTDPERADERLDDWRYDGDALLDGLHRVDGTHPTLAPGGETAGRLLVTTELARLDAYEGVAIGLYVRVAAPLDQGGNVGVRRRPRPARRAGGLAGCGPLRDAGPGLPRVVRGTGLANPEPVAFGTRRL